MSIGGFSITDSAIRFFSIDKGRPIKAAVSLPPGAIKNGQIQDREQVLFALRKIHALLPYPVKPTPVILTALPGQILAQSFTTPVFLDEAGLKDSLQLNLKTLSPWDPQATYYDAQPLSSADSGQLIFLGAFVKSDIVGPLIKILEEADFNPVAIEFPALSLSRLIKQWGIGLNFSENHLFLDLNDGGFAVGVLARGELHYSRSVAWETVSQGGDDPQGAIGRELQQAAAFYQTHFGGEPNALIFTPNIVTEFLLALQDRFKFKIKKLGLKSFGDLKPDWFSAVGAYLRGLVPRGEDVLVSLDSEGTESRYWHSFVAHFVSRWRNWVLIGLASTLLIFLGINTFLLRTENRLRNELADVARRSEVNDLKSFYDQAAYFNGLVELVKDIESQTLIRSAVVARLQELAGRAVVFDELSLSGANGIIVGRGDSELAVVDFKNRLAADRRFINVELPLSGIVTGPDKKALFTLSFQIALP